MSNAESEKDVEEASSSYAYGLSDVQEPNSNITNVCVRDTEELAYRLLMRLPRLSLATIQRRIASLLQFDIVGQLPTELALQVFSYLPSQTLLTCALVSRRWRTLADDQSLWKCLCQARGWVWKDVSGAAGANEASPISDRNDSDDEGMGDSADDGEVVNPRPLKAVAQALRRSQSAPYTALGFPSAMAVQASRSPQVIQATRSSGTNHKTISTSSAFRKVPPSGTNRFNNDATSFLSSFETSTLKPNYKLLHQTHIKLRNRILTSSYRLSTLQTRGRPPNAHSNTIYCLQLYTYPESGNQVLFTGSRDKTIREWNLSKGTVERVIDNVHSSSILTLCVHGGYLASAGSDRRVALWHLGENRLWKVICDHEDSVLCVRFNDKKLVSCSKDRTVRIYSFPDLEAQFVLNAHSAAVNSVAISDVFVVSASGDRSIRLWDANTGALIRTLANHHTRGIASIDFSPPVVLSGSSDKHVRFFDMTTLQGWSTIPKDETFEGNSNVLPFSFPPSLVSGPTSCSNTGSSGCSLDSTHHDGTVSLICQDCGSNRIESRVSQINRQAPGNCAHGDLVRIVALRQDFVLSGSYDSSIKIWDRKTGVLVANLTGGHTGKIFCIGFDSKKIVSCGDDQRICIWDFSYGIDTRFLS